MIYNGSLNQFFLKKTDYQINYLNNQRNKKILGYAKERTKEIICFSVT